jgi:hypothetical protein
LILIGRHGKAKVLNLVKRTHCVGGPESTFFLIILEVINTRPKKRGGGGGGGGEERRRRRRRRRDKNEFQFVVCLDGRKIKGVIIIFP